MPAHVHPFLVYYEDTDFTGVVYHANYLKYMERAREHCLGVDELVRRWRDERMGFAVYHADITFKEPARHGDTLEVHTTLTRESRYRFLADQRIRRPDSRKDMVIGRIQLVTIRGEAGKLCDLPDDLEPVLRRYAPDPTPARRR